MEGVKFSLKIKHCMLKHRNQNLEAVSTLDRYEKLTFPLISLNPNDINSNKVDAVAVMSSSMPCRVCPSLEIV